MNAFDDIKLTWAGEEKVIPARSVLGAIYRVEKVLTLEELTVSIATRGTVPHSTLAMAYGILLRYAGFTVTDDEVYLGTLGTQEKGAEQSAVAMVTMLLCMMVPPEIQERMQRGESVERPVAKGEKPLGKREAVEGKRSRHSSRR